MKRLFRLFANILLVSSAWCIAGTAAHAQTTGSDGNPIYSVNAKSTQPKHEREAAGSGHVPASVNKYWFKYSDGKYERGDRGAGQNLRLEDKIRDKPELGLFEFAEFDGGSGGGTQTCYVTPITIQGYWQPYSVVVDGAQGDSGWDFIITGFTGGETVCT